MMIENDGTPKDVKEGGRGGRSIFEVPVLPSIQLGEVGEINNKKFCEELIPYFP
jgi:hypothetical protein